MIIGFIITQNLQYSTEYSGTVQSSNLLVDQLARLATVASQLECLSLALASQLLLQLKQLHCLATCSQLEQINRQLLYHTCHCRQQQLQLLQLHCTYVPQLAPLALVVGVLWRRVQLATQQLSEDIICSSPTQAECPCQGLPFFEAPFPAPYALSLRNKSLLLAQFRMLFTLGFLCISVSLLQLVAREQQLEPS